jgi:uridine phosphorylase
MNKASAPKTTEGGTVHLGLRVGDVPPYAILPGDPARTLRIAEGWTDVREVAYNREFKTVTGLCGDVRIGCTSTGVGAASSEIAIHELWDVGVHTCVRVGTTGCIQPDIALGDLIIPYACVRRDGTSDAYIGPEYPAAASPIVVMALLQACENLGYDHRIGVGYTASSFYIGQSRPIGEAAADGTPGGYWPSFADDLIPDLRRAGITNIEMEAGGQFVVGALHGMRMGAILAVVANRVTDEWGDRGGEEKSCRAAAEAIRILAGWDAEGRIDLSVRT